MSYKQRKIQEGNLELIVPLDNETNLSKKDPVFYNPAAKISREITMSFVKSVSPKSCLDLLAASGALGLLIAKNLPDSKVILNDANSNAVELINKNIELNDLKNAKTSNKDANKFLKESKKFEYIDIDPFGPPVPFLDNAVQKTKKYIAVTSTDTSALAGTYPKACLRKYDSLSLKNEFMQETGIRILIKRVLEFGIEHDIAFKPVFSFNCERYSRVFLKIVKNIEEIRENLGYISYCNECLWRKSAKIRKKCCPNCGGKLKHAGKLWIGTLWENKLVRKMLESKVSYDTKKLLKRIEKESKIKEVGFYDLHKISKKYKKERVPKIEKVIDYLHKKGFKASRTHFSPTGIRTDSDLNIFTTE